jgi:RIO kinase 1
MSTNDYFEFLDELDTDEQQNYITNTGRHRPRKSNLQPKKKSKETHDFVRDQDDSRVNFKFTYKAARFEEWWLLDSLGDFYEHKWISDVLSRVKGGKEASVYLCRTDSAEEVSLLAAKVYRPRSLRNLKNDGQYRAGRADLDESGRVILDDRVLRAMEKRTVFGEELRHQSWIAYEYQALKTLYAIGADVPKPYTMAKNAILMEYVGDKENPAPSLNTVSMDVDEAKSILARVLRNIDLMLAQDRIHGDLSAYNILYWEGRITLIDFPQVVLLKSNPAAWVIFQRDVDRICQYFTSRGVACDSYKLAVALWTSHGNKIHKEIHPRDLDADKSEDRLLWEKQKNAQ